MILVFGATGTTGGEVARQLIAKGVRPRLLVRDPAKAKQFEGKAELAQGDYGNLGDALDGVEKIYLVSSGLEGQKQERAVIDAAKKAKVKHVVKLSVLGAGEPSFAFSRWHHETEEHLRNSGLAFTLLRPSNFTTNSLGWAQTVKGQGAFYQPTASGKYPVIDPSDIGAVAVQALTSPGHEGKAYTLTGPESIDGAAYAERLSRAIGKPVKFVDVPPEAAKDSMLKMGMPADYVTALLELLAAMKAGKLDVVTADVQKVVGRAPRSFEDWARQNRAAFI